MVDIIKTEFGDIGIQYLPKDDLMPDRGTLSIEKAKRLLGYGPRYPLESGFVKYIRWYNTLVEQHRHLFDDVKPSLKLVKGC